MTEATTQTQTATETEVTEISESISEPEESVSGGGQCESGQFMDKYGSCYSCSESSPQSSIEDECAKCDDTSTPRVMSSDGRCALPCSSGEFMDEGGLVTLARTPIAYP